MRKTVHRTRSIRPVAQLSNFGATHCDIGLARFSPTGWTLQTKMQRINKTLRDGEGIISVPKICTTVADDVMLCRQLELLLDADPAWSFFHPAIHPTGELVVFAARRQSEQSRFDPDGTGGTDLWYSCKSRGSWTTPRKFDTLINSQADEIFPTFNSTGTLFFSSNRSGGRGGFDLYQATVYIEALRDAKKAAWWEAAKPLSDPMNSAGDDLALVWRSDADSRDQSGYLARSLKPNDHDMDIYSFRYRYPTCTGMVVSSHDHLPIPGATALFIYDAGDTVSAITDQSGHFRAILQYGKAYTVYLVAPGYFRSSKAVLSTIALAQGANLSLDTTTLTAIEMPQNIIWGTVTSLAGVSLLPNATLEFYADSPRAITPKMEKFDDHFIVYAERNLDFYIDISTPMPTSNSWHYIPETYQVDDTVFADIVLGDSNIQVRRVIVAYEGTADVPGIPIAKLLLFPPQMGEPVELSYDIGIDGASVRLGTPTDASQRCSLVVAQVGYIPAVLDPRREAIPDTVRLVPSSKRYQDPIIIYHKFNEREPDYDLSAKDLEGISLFLIQDPEAKIQVASHTDCRGSEAYNLSLSKRRAEMVKRFILLRTDPSFANRITAVGKGENFPAINCNGDPDCTEAMHSENRRTEILLERPNLVSEYHPDELNTR